MPLPASKPVHQRWASVNARVAAGLQNATVRIYLPGATTGWDPGTGDTTTAGTDLYTGRARLMPIRRQAEQSIAAGQPTSARRYNVSIPTTAVDIPAGQAVGALVHVTAVDANTDPTLLSATFRVIDAAPTTGALERVLVCVLDETNQGA